MDFKKENPESSSEKSINVDNWLDTYFKYRTHPSPELSYVHFMLNYFRYPAFLQIAYKPFMDKFKLFVTWRGKRWRVTGASRLGDIYLQSDFSSTHGYNHRVGLDFDELTDWSDTA